MAQVIGQIDSLTTLLNIFKENKISFFKSLDDIVHFRNYYNNIVRSKYKQVMDSLIEEIKNYKLLLTELISDYNQKLSEREETLQKEKENLLLQIGHYSVNSKNIFKILYCKYKLYDLKRRKDILENDFENEKRRPYNNLEKEINVQKDKISYLENNFDKIFQERFKVIEDKYIKAESLLKEHYPIFLGAIGEEKAVDVLKTLPESYYVINDFNLDIKPPIFNKNTGDYIQSIQADHIVIGPAGVFLIETKNWSNKSIKNKDFYSPVEQLKRTSYALFIYLNDPCNYDYSFLRHDWGSRKVSVRNILLMINNKPAQEFQFVKVLSLNEIIGYIKYFKPVFSKPDVETIYNLLSKLD